MWQVSRWSSPGHPPTWEPKDCERATGPSAPGRAWLLQGEAWPFPASSLRARRAEPAGCQGLDHF